MKQNINAKTKKKTESEEEQKQDGERMQDWCKDKERQKDTHLDS